MIVYHLHCKFHCLFVILFIDNGHRGNIQFKFVGNGANLVKVATEHDVVPTDLGEGRIDQHDGSVVMGGAPAINNAGDVAFIASLTPADNNQIEWGSGLFIAYGSLLFADGFESGDTSRWSVVAP